MVFPPTGFVRIPRGIKLQIVGPIDAALVLVIYIGTSKGMIVSLVIK